MRKRSATPAPSDARSTRTMSSRTIRWRQATRSRSSHRSPGAETMAVRVQEQDFDLGAELAALTAGNHRIGGLGVFVGVVRDIAGGATRSEEHTSELQSLMRISYAVFCLKKKKRNNKT